MNREKLESAKNLFSIALGIDIAVTAIVVMSDIWGAGVLKDVGAGRIVADQSTMSTFEFWNSFSKLILLTMLGVGLGLVRWLNTCYSYAKEAIGASGFKNEGWTAGGWIIPIFNLFKPYQIINEIYKAGSSTYTGPDGWKRESASGLLLTWWIFWVVTHFIGCIVGKQMFKSAMRDDLTLQQSIGAIELHALFCAVFLIVSGLWLVVAGNLTRRLLDRQRVGAAPILHGQPITAGLPMPSQNPEPSQPVTLPQAQTQIDPGQPTKTISQATANTTQFANPTQSPKFLPQSESNEEDFWATAMTEVETGQRRPGVWAKAFTECDGDETKAKIAYLKARVKQLTEAAKALEAQREAERLDAIEKAQKAALEMEQEIERLSSKFVSSGAISKKELKFLVNHGTEVRLSTLRDELQGNSLLHLCAENNMVEEVNVLLLASVDPDHSNNVGVLPGSLTKNSLIRQLCNGLKVSQEQLKALIYPAMGLCPNCHDAIPAEVHTCPSCQALFGPTSAWKVQCLDEVEMVRELKSIYHKQKPTANHVKYLVAASIRDSSLISLVDSHKFQATLLHWCAHYGLLEQAQVLLANGANPKAKNSHGLLPFEWCENDELWQTLNNAAKLAEAQDASLLEAVIKGNWSSAKTLLENGIRPTGCDGEGKSLLDHARANNDTLMITLLQSHGST